MADPSAWEENDRVRTEASSAIARAAQAAHMQRLVQESIAFVYAEGGDAWLDEDAPVAGRRGDDRADGRAQRTRAVRRRQRGVRFGLFIGPDSESTLAALTPRAAARRSRRTAQRVRPMLWLDDAAADRRGAGSPAGRTTSRTRTVHERRDRCRAGRRCRGRSLAPRAPQDGPLARSQRVSSRRLREASGWTPRLRGGTRRRWHRTPRDVAA